MSRESQRRFEAAERAARAFIELHGAEPCDTDFFAFVRWIEGYLPDRPRVGRSLRMSEEALIFHQKTYLEFAPSTVKRVRALPPRDSGGAVGRMEGYFLGLLGPSGPMPLAMTEYVSARSNGIPHPDRITPTAGNNVSLHRRDSSLEDFFNIFNHRFISFFYRAWAACRKSVDFDRPADARFPEYVGSFVGLGMPSLRGRLEVPDEEILYFAGHITNRSRHAEGLAAIASDYFRTEAVIEENVGHWISLADDDCGVLGSPMAGPLGAGVVLGGRIWDRQLRFMLRLGAMPYALYSSLFPGSKALESLVCLVKFYTNRELFCTANLVLAKEEYPGAQLGAGCRLGLSTWLFSGQPDHDLDDLLIEIQ